MQSKFQTIFVSLLLLFVFWTSSALAQSEELLRPTRPDSFNSPEEVAQYVKQLQDYFRSKSVRFGKRLAPMPNNLQKNEELEAADQINELNKQILENNRQRALSSQNYLMSMEVEEEDEKNPQEQLARQQMTHALPPPMYARAPLPLIARYLHARRQPQQLRVITF